MQNNPTISRRIRGWMQEGEDVLTSLLGLIIAISGLIAFADVFSSGRALLFLPWLLWVWIITQAIAVDYQFYTTVKRQFTERDVDTLVYWTRWVLILVLGLLVIVIGAIFAVHESQGTAVDASMSFLGIPLKAFMYVRAASPVLLLFVIAVDHALARKDQKASPLQPADAATAVQPTDLAVLLEQLDERYSRRMETIVEQVVTRVQVSLPQRAALAALPEPEERPGGEPTEPAGGQADSVSQARVEQVQAILAEAPETSVRDVAKVIGRSKSTAHKVIKKARNTQAIPLE